MEPVAEEPVAVVDLSEEPIEGCLVDEKLVLVFAIRFFWGLGDGLASQSIDTSSRSVFLW